MRKGTVSSTATFAEHLSNPSSIKSKYSRRILVLKSAKDILSEACPLGKWRHFEGTKSSLNLKPVLHPDFCVTILAFAI